jgi:hypothetical protein
VGSSYLFIKIGVETLPTFTLVALRLGIGLAFLVAVVAAAREGYRASPGSTATSSSWPASTSPCRSR